MNTARRVLIPFGSRTEMVRLTPVIRALRVAGHHVNAIDTGQADPAVTAILQRELGLRADGRFRLPPNGSARRQGSLFAGAVQALDRYPADLVLVTGGGATVPSYALAARAAGVPIVHLDAGLRSFDETDPAEVNQKIAAATAQLHFAPTDRAAAFLAAEGVSDERIFVVGHPGADALTAVPRTAAETRDGAVVVIRRPQNLDPARVAALLTALAARVGPVGCHDMPAEEAWSALPGVTLDGPAAHRDFAAALAGARVVVTDSDDIVEEAGHLGVPVVILRSGTVHWSGVMAGAAVLTGFADEADAERAVHAAEAFAAPAENARVAALTAPYGTPGTGRRVAEILADPATGELLAFRTPDLREGLPARTS